MKARPVRCLALFLLTAAMGTQSAVAGPAMPTLHCLSVDSCGCRIVLSGQACSAGGAHFFHALADGAPLHFDPGTGPTRAASTRAPGDAFTPAPGEAWTETYRYGDGSVEIHYSPGADTCPKRTPGESCEYFDVHVRVLFQRPQGGASYQGVGTCGC